MSRNVVEFGKSIHEAVERVITKGKRMKKEKDTPVELAPYKTEAQLLAARLRVESAIRERDDFAKKMAKRQPFDASGEGEEEEEEQAASLTGDLGPTDIAMMEMLWPTLDDQMSRPGSSLTGRSIKDEIVEDRYMGKIKPFVEGEPIGAAMQTCLIQPYRHLPASPLKTRNDIMDDRQKKLRKRQRQNDATLKRLLEAAK